MRVAPTAMCRQSRVGISYVLSAAAQYVTNHIINAIPFYSVRHAWYRHALGWYLAPGAVVRMGQTVQLNALRANGRRVSIDRGTVIGTGCLISTAGGLVIGQHVYLAPGVWLITGVRDPDDPDFKVHYLSIIIDDYACIGARATILGGITIGKGAVVRTGAIVAQDVEPFTIVEGVPAHMVGARTVKSPSYRLSPGPLLG
jgi:acetyltransferase-like isoleucine patch superfamily enzyme